MTQCIQPLEAAIRNVEALIVRSSRAMVISTTQRRASSEQAQFFSYGEAANPIRSGLIPVVPYRSFSPTFFDESGSAVLPLDLSAELLCNGPATGPSLCANFVRVHDTELRTAAVATSQLFSWPMAKAKPKPAASISAGARATCSSYPQAAMPFTPVAARVLSTGCTTRHCCASGCHAQ